MEYVRSEDARGCGLARTHKPGNADSCGSCTEKDNLLIFECRPASINGVDEACKGHGCSALNVVIEGGVLLPVLIKEIESELGRELRRCLSLAVLMLEAS